MREDADFRHRLVPEVIEGDINEVAPEIDFGSLTARTPLPDGVRPNAADIHLFIALLSSSNFCVVPLAIFRLQTKVLASLWHKNRFRQP